MTTTTTAARRERRIAANKAAAQHEYRVARGEVIALIAELAARHGADADEVDPTRINFGHVGDLKALAYALRVALGEEG